MIGSGIGIFSTSRNGISSKIFTATAGQTQFDVSDFFPLDDNYLVFLNGALQTFGHSQADSIVTFTAGLVLGDEVVIVN